MNAGVATAGRPGENVSSIMDPAGTSDAVLMARVATGDRAAFAALITRHQGYVHKLAYRFVGRWDVADDLTQDTFLRVHRAAATYKPSAAFSTWLYRLVVNLCRDWRRGQAHREYVPLEARLPVADRTTARIDNGETARAVRAAIDALPDNQREALILHRYVGLSHREIAEIVGRSESAVESYLVRAYVNLRASLRSLSGADTECGDDVTTNNASNTEMGRASSQG